MPESPNFLTPEAAKYLRVSVRTLIRWRNLREGPVWTRVGRKVVYQKEDLDAWLDSQRRPGPGIR